MSRKMKDSGVEWIREIPENWSIVKYKYFADSGMGNTILREDTIENGVPVYSATQGDGIFGYLKEPNLKLSKGDFVIPARGNSIGFVYIIKEDLATCTQTTIYSKLRNINVEFLFYCTVGLKDYWFEFDNTAIPQITVSQVQNNLVPIPKFEEQKQIANFLDQKVGEIDHIIDKTKLSIEEYKKYKQSLITETVTKGLNPDAKMKESGIEWIGEIPEHWETIKLKYKFFINKDIAGKDGFNILSVTQSGLKIKDISKNEGQIAADYSKYQIVNKGDYVMNHMDLLTGWVDNSIYEGVTSPDYRVFKLQIPEEHCIQYYNYIFQMCYSNKIFYGLGQGVSNLGRWRLQTDKFLNFILPIPPKKEQILISNYIEQKCLEIYNLITQKEHLISELELYKKSLIFECVTGKREVL